MEPIPSLLSLDGVQPIVMPDTQQSLWNRGDCKGNFQPPASRNGAAVAEVTCELQSSFTSAVVHQESPRVTVRRGTKKELKLFCGENNSQINPKHWNLSEKKKKFRPKLREWYSFKNLPPKVTGDFMTSHFKNIISSSSSLISTNNQVKSKYYRALYVSLEEQ